MKRRFCLLFIYILIICLTMVLYNDLTVVIADIKNENIAIINTEHVVSEYVTNIVNGRLQNGDEKVKFTKLGDNYINIIFKNDLGKNIEEKVKINVIDNINPEIEYKKIITMYENEKINLLNDVKVRDNSNEVIIPTIIGEYNIEEAGIYNLYYEATDSSGNSTKVPFTLIVKNIMPNKDTYYVKLNKTQNVLMVYKKDNIGNYTKLYKTFVISAGNDTPVGMFKASTKTEVISFTNGTYGRYATRIYNSFWFHSVPYNSRPSDNHWNNISYNEYNKLGTLASAGCIRLSVKDAKWLYENIVSGTTIEIYESDILPEGVVKPIPMKIDVNSKNKGWDPTDIDDFNPWYK